MDFWLVLRSLIFSHSLSLQIQRISPRNPCSLIQMNMDFWLVRRWIWNFMTPNYAVRSGIWICPYQWDHRWIWISDSFGAVQVPLNSLLILSPTIRRERWGPQLIQQRTQFALFSPVLRLIEKSTDGSDSCCRAVTYPVSRERNLPSFWYTIIPSSGLRQNTRITSNPTS